MGERHKVLLFEIWVPLLHEFGYIFARSVFDWLHIIFSLHFIMAYKISRVLLATFGALPHFIAIYFSTHYCHGCLLLRSL